MSIYDRPMFRKKGGATGIMASGPELIKRSNGGGFNIISSAQGSPLLTGAIDYIPNAPTAVGPFSAVERTEGARNPRRRDGKRIFPVVDFMGTETGEVDKETKKTQLEELSELENQVTKETKKGPEDITNKINEVNKKILNSGVTKTKDIVDEETGEVFTTTEDDSSLVGTKQAPTEASSFNFDTTKKSMTDISNEIQGLYNNYSADLTNLGNRDIFGTTMNKAVEEYRTALNKKPKDLDFADVKDDVFELLGYDRDTLDQRVDKEKQSAIWLNVMRAGLAVAAGESPNALTNVAKGFSVGLEGYGKDINNINEDYREDLKTYTTTAYTMLKDAKAEELAKNTLNLQRAAAEFKITSEFFGQEREDLLNKLNREVATRMLKLNHLKAFSEMDFERFKFDVSLEQQQEANKLAFAKLKMMTPEVITGAVIDGFVELKDPTKPPTFDNLKPTQKFIESGKSLTDILSKKNVTRVTDTAQTRDIQGELGGYGITYIGSDKIPTNIKEAIGEKMIELNKSTGAYQSAVAGTLPDANKALGAVISAYRPLQKYDNVKLDFEMLDDSIKDEILTVGTEANERYNKNKDLFINLPSQTEFNNPQS